MSFYTIPQALKSVLDNESIDFSIKSKRNHPKNSAMAMLAFSLFWNAFVSIFIVAFIVPLFTEGEVHFLTNDVPTVATLENWKPMLVPCLIIGVFVLVGLLMLGYGLVMMFQSGAYFVGTPTRFIKYRKGTVTVTDWEQFSGNIKLTNKNLEGSLSLELRTGKIRSRDKGADRFVPDIIHIASVENVFKIEKLCRKRIKENDPTPAKV